MGVDLILPRFRQTQDDGYNNYEFFGYGWNDMHVGRIGDELYIEMKLLIGAFPITTIDVQLYMRYEKDIDDVLKRVTPDKDIKILDSITSLMKDIGMYDIIERRLNDTVDGISSMLKSCKTSCDLQGVFKHYNDVNPVVFLYEL